MKILLDTHLLLWAAGPSDRLSAAARTVLENLQNELLFSAASLWEIAIKRGLGREDFQVDARLLRRGLLDNGYQELAIPANMPSPSTACRRSTKTPSIEFLSRRRPSKAFYC